MRWHGGSNLARALGGGRRQEIERGPAPEPEDGESGAVEAHATPLEQFEDIAAVGLAERPRAAPKQQIEQRGHQGPYAGSTPRLRARRESRSYRAASASSAARPASVWA